MPKPAEVTLRQQRLMEYMLNELRKNTLPASIEREGAFLLGYVFALECSDQVKERLRALLRNAAEHAQRGVDWPFRVPGGRA